MLFLKRRLLFRFNFLRNENLFSCRCKLRDSLFHHSASLLGQIKLSPQEISDILRSNEFSHDFRKENYAIKSYDSNQLPSNTPIEDTRAEDKCLLTKGTLIGVFDGHGGPGCAQVSAKRLSKYICAGLLPHDLLDQYLQSLQKDQPIPLIERYNEKYELVPELEKLHHQSFVQYVKNLLSSQEDFCMENVLEKAILALDEDISAEALRTNAFFPNLRTISVAMSGAVACIAHIDGSHLHVANVGDCRAVLGVLTEENSWIAKELTRDHNVDNVSEVFRIKNEHPPNEADTVIRQGRLLGQLAPLRALGDVRYKWSVEKLLKVAAPLYGDNVIAYGYHTPPYLTAKPELTYHRLMPRDKFLIIASDGLWDIATPQQAVRLVGEHLRGKMVLNPFKLPKRNINLRDLNTLLLQRKECFNMKPIDGNAATHLLRNALGGTDYGDEHDTLSKILTLSQDKVRFFRDDITISIVFFDSEYLRQVHT